ncbi:MAG: leucine-rich repeat domain-containing protein, partial [Lachnospiraceae bacterium]|nr:leucine-rich repeat domain-containing protein [Lachnospiraceae bacterium]
MIMLILANCIECVKASAEKYELSEQYCDLVVGEHKSISFDVDREEDVVFPYEKVSWSCDSDDIVLASGEGKGEIDISAVKCSGKKHSHAVITAKYENVTLKCDVVVYAKAKYKYKIITQKSKKTLCVGETKTFCVKTNNGKRAKNVKWYVKEDEIGRNSVKINKRGEVTAVKFNDISPMLPVICADFGYIHLECKLDVYAKRDKKELEALKKIIGRTNLRNSEKKYALSSKNCIYCLWDGLGHVRELELNDVKIKGHVSVKEFSQLESLEMENNYISSIDLGKSKSLDRLILGRNLLKEIDLSGQPKLERLFLNDNKLK